MRAWDSDGNHHVDRSEFRRAIRALGFDAEGSVFFSYGVATDSSGSGYTVDAGADIDGDGIVQFWGYTKLAADGSLVGGQVGCATSSLTVQQIGPCVTGAGKIIF